MTTENNLLSSPCQELGSPDELATAIEELAKRLSYFNERRSCCRYPFNVPLSLYNKSEDGQMEKITEAWGLNISSIGLGLLSRSSFPRNSQIYVDLKPLIGESLFAKVNVVHCSEPIDQIHRIGGYFAF